MRTEASETGHELWKPLNSLQEDHLLVTHFIINLFFFFLFSCLFPSSSSTFFTSVLLSRKVGPLLCLFTPADFSLTAIMIFLNATFLFLVRWRHVRFPLWRQPSISSSPAETVRLPDPRLHQALHRSQLPTQTRQDPLGQRATGAQKGRTRRAEGNERAIKG